MTDPVTIVLVGLGGYGEVYLAALLDDPRYTHCRLVAGVDPAPQRCARLSDLRTRNIPIFDSLRAFYAHDRADLAVLSSPIHDHCPQSCLAVEHGSHVLCEKPAAAAVQDVDAMIAAAERTGRCIAIGYQWSFSASISTLKRDIAAGRFGRALRLRSLALWPRPLAYYHRNDWAGRLRHPDGRWILDSPANNAMAHFLHHLLYLLGPTPDTSATPQDISAETYRTNDIETFDTIAARLHTDTNAEIVFYASHAADRTADPVFSIDFTDASLRFTGSDNPIVVETCAGETLTYDSPNCEPQAEKLRICARAVRETAPIPCHARTARSHTICVNGIHESSPRPASFPPAMIEHHDEPPSLAVTGLAAALTHCYEHAALPAELAYPWARSGRTIDLRDYRTFPRA